MTYEIPASTQTRVRNDINAIRSAFPALDEAEANCVRMNRGIVSHGGVASYFPYDATKLRPAVEAEAIEGLSA